MKRINKLFHFSYGLCCKVVCKPRCLVPTSAHYTNPQRVDELIQCNECIIKNFHSQLSNFRICQWFGIFELRVWHCLHFEL